MVAAVLLVAVAILSAGTSARGRSKPYLGEGVRNLKAAAPVDVEHDLHHDRAQGYFCGTQVNGITTPGHIEATYLDLSCTLPGIVLFYTHARTHARTHTRTPMEDEKYG